MNKIKEMSETTVGVIIKSVGGLYSVETPDGVVSCKARGIFRKDGISPYVGDKVTVMEIGNNEAIIAQILPRKNFIIRPPVANIDFLVFVVSTVEPQPNLEVLDKFLAIAEFKHITPLIAVTKTDRVVKSVTNNLYNIYNDNVAEVFPIDYNVPETVWKLRRKLFNSMSVFTGNTGVGKSTLINHLDEDINAEVGEVSRKLGRGKHTTRTVEYYKLSSGAYVADTPGFGVFDTNRYDYIYKNDLADCFPDFRPFLGKCRYQDCSHTKEQGCAVIESVRSDIIHRSRFESYLRMYSEASALKTWEVGRDLREFA
jgi:ribosome biogenesis GTPase